METEHDTEPWVHREAIVNGIRLHYVEAGDGPLVLLLHGFPEFWYSWRHQIPALAAAGFHVVAPDLRGYNLSEKPLGVMAYHIKHLVADVATMLRTFGGAGGGFLVGHDWGGLLAWHAAARHPELAQKLAILNAPHPTRYLEVVRAERRQKLISLYVLFFQLPWLPELLFTAFHGALTTSSIRSALKRPASFTPQDERRYRAAITQPGAATSALNYYRAMAWRTWAHGMREPQNHIPMPTLMLWGMNDPALHPANIEREPLLRCVPDLRIQPLDTGHFVHIDAPAEVNPALIQFLKFDNVATAGNMPDTEKPAIIRPE